MPMIVALLETIGVLVGELNTFPFKNWW